MKKMSKLGKSILLSSLAVIAFGGIAAGSTYALFTSEANTNVTVSTGKVLVEKTVTLEDAKTLNEGNEVDAPVSGNTVIFGCGGTAIIKDDGNVELSNIVAGDKVTVKVHAINKSTVGIKYRAIVKVDGDFKDIVSLEGKATVDDATADMKVSKTGLFTEYKTIDGAAPAEGGDLGDYTLTFGIDKDTSVKNGDSKSGTVSISIEAIQGNAKVEDEQPYQAVSNPSELSDAISHAEENSIIEVTEALNLENTLSISKDMTLIFDDDVTAPAGKTAIEVTNGTVTIGESTTTSSEGTGLKNARKYAFKTTGAKIIATGKSNAIETSGNGKIVINGGTIQAEKGKGVKVSDGGNATINGGSITSTNDSAIGAVNGTVVINDGTFEAQEAGVIIHNASSLTINGGTFETVDNFVVGTNGTTDWGRNTIEINGGTFNGNIQSSGYIACGVYVANDDTVNITGGTFNITNGCGILARSGNTTVSDDVVFNFENTDGGITEGGVGDKSCNIPVNARIVKDVSNPEYPGGTPVVTGKCVVDVIKTTGKTYLVSTEDELNNAIADTTNSIKYIHLKNNLTVNNMIEVLTSDTVIYGKGDTELIAKNDKNRLFALYGDDHSALNGGSFSLVGIDAKTSDTKGEGQVFLTYDLQDFDLTLDSSSLAAKYPLDISGDSKNIAGTTDNVTIKGRNVVINGYCAVQVSADAKKISASFENSTLTGYNQYGGGSDDFATISLNDNVKDANFDFKNCTLNANAVETGKEYFIMAKNSTSGSATFDSNCSFKYNNNVTVLKDHVCIYGTSTFSY